MSWCLQCGLSGKPERAVGVDEDGEPACTFHRVKEIGSGLNAASALQARVPLSVQLKPAAAPSPVQTSAVEESSMDNKRTCSCGCGAELRSRWPYVKGHNKVEGGATVAAPKKPRKNIEKNSDGSFTVRVHELAHEPLPLGGNQQSTDLEVALRFTGEKLDKIWGLLSLEQKAVAIDAIINNL